MLNMLLIPFAICILAAGHDGPPRTAPSSQAAAAGDRLAWWREARFGMFIHWGLYAVPAGRWEGKPVPGVGEWIMSNGRIPVDEYEKLRDQFNPAKFDADQWVRIAKDAGMKYIVITTKHHDGFCLFDSKYTDYDVMSTPFKRDVMRELSQACRRAGVRMCWYHSIMDWHHPDYLPRRPWDKRPTADADFQRYRTCLNNQIEELLSRYGDIGLMWFDGQWEETWTHEAGQALYDHCRRLQPQIIVNNRVDKGTGLAGGGASAVGFAGDYSTPEQEIPAGALPGDWETCMTMNDTWGYKTDDTHWKSAGELIRNLIDIASKGGNFLLNVGPTGAGEIPPASVERLAAMGRWMRVNGESIYGTSAGPFRSLPWGRCTQRRLAGGRTVLYLHVFDWPKDGRLVVPGLYNDSRRASLLAGGVEADLPVARQDDALVVTLPAQAPDDVASVVALEIDGRPDVAEPPRLTAPAHIFIDSLNVAATTDRKNVQIRYTVDGSDPTAKSPEARQAIGLNNTAVVSVRCFRGDRAVSPVHRETFTKVKVRPSERLTSAQAGLSYECFEGDWDRLPGFATLKAARTGVVSSFDCSVRTRPEHVAIRYSGYVTVPRDGVYTFSLASDDGSRLYIGDELLIDNDGLHELVDRIGDIALAAGAHPITVTFFQKTGGIGLAVRYAGPGVERQIIPPAALSTGRRATPSGPASGE